MNVFTQYITLDLFIKRVKIKYFSIFLLAKQYIFYFMLNNVNAGSAVVFYCSSPTAFSPGVSYPQRTHAARVGLQGHF